MAYEPDDKAKTSAFKPTVISNDAAAATQRMVSRFENLLTQAADLKADMSELRKEAKENGYNPQALAKAAKLRLSAKVKLKEEHLLGSLFTYMRDCNSPMDVDEWDFGAPKAEEDDTILKEGKP